MKKGMQHKKEEVWVVINVEENVHLISNQRYVNGNHKERPFFSSYTGNAGKKVRKWSLKHTACGSAG